MLAIGFQRTHKNAIVPTKAYQTDAGLDFYSLYEVSIKPGESGVIDTGVKFEVFSELPKYYLCHPIKYIFLKLMLRYTIPFLKLESRSGLSFKHAIEVGAGIIDSTYRGEIRIKVYNNSKETVVFKAGDRAAQGIVFLIPKISICEVASVSDSSRGNKGFGSSGN